MFVCSMKCTGIGFRFLGRKARRALPVDNRKAVHSVSTKRKIHVPSSDDLSGTCILGGGSCLAMSKGSMDSPLNSIRPSSPEK